jgi:GH18 family chitinase
VSYCALFATTQLTLLHSIDWEYPGGNGADYKQVPNSARSYQIEAFPKLLAATRTAIGPNKLLSIAAPGKKGRDLIKVLFSNTDNFR